MKLLPPQTEEEYFQAIKIDGRKCWIRSNRLGYLCGYVELSEDEYKRGYEDGYWIFEVHGGITWDGGEIRGIKIHKKNRLIGFDCAHLGDAPWSGESFDSEDTYKDPEYVLNEIQGLVLQIEKMHEKWKMDLPAESAFSIEFKEDAYW